jgi:hypothetical protein
MDEMMICTGYELDGARPSTICPPARAQQARLNAGL